MGFTHWTLGVGVSGAGWIRTSDLRLMKAASYHCSTALSVDVRTFISPTKRIQFVPVAPSRRPVQVVPLSRPVVTELVQSERRFRRTTTRRVSSETGRLLRLIHRTSRGEKSAERARIAISNPMPAQRHRVIPNRVDHLT